MGMRSLGRMMTFGCIFCGTSFQRSYGHAVRRNGRLFCSKSCSAMAQRKKESDYYKIDKNGCWNWISSFYPDGYGVLQANGKSMPAYKFLYEKYKGKVPDGLELDHLCRNKKCVNPDHLEPVTHAVNMQRCKRAKITMEIAKEIRSLKGIFDRRELSKRFGLSFGSINSIWSNRTWIC